MRNLATVLGQMAAIVAILAAFSVASAYCIWAPWGRLPYIDTEQMHTIYTPEPVGVADGITEINPDERNLFLVGSSNVREGFRPNVISDRLPGFTVHNVAIGASNIAEVYEIVQYVNHFLSPVGRKNAVYVVGIWYGQFVSNQKRWNERGLTDLDVELRKFHTFTANDYELRPTVPVPRSIEVNYMRLFVPLIAAKRFIIYASRTQIRAPYTGVVDANYEAESMKFWRDYMGAADDVTYAEQFGYLSKLSEFVRHTGGKLVLVDMPLPVWHKRHSPYEALFQDLKRTSLQSLLTSQNVGYIDMQAFDREDDFYDSAHPKALTAARWSAALASSLKTQAALKD
jgi:hypothetical protein